MHGSNSGGFIRHFKMYAVLEQLQNRVAVPGRNKLRPSHIGRGRDGCSISKTALKSGYGLDCKMQEGFRNTVAASETGGGEP